MSHDNADFVKEAAGYYLIGNEWKDCFLVLNANGRLEVKSSDCVDTLVRINLREFASVMSAENRTNRPDSFEIIGINWDDTNQTIKHTFYVSHANECKEWIQTIENVICDHIVRRQSNISSNSSNNNNNNNNSSSSQDMTENDEGIARMLEISESGIEFNDIMQNLQNMENNNNNNNEFEAKMESNSNSNSNSSGNQLDALLAEHLRLVEENGSRAARGDYNNFGFNNNNNNNNNNFDALGEAFDQYFDDFDPINIYNQFNRDMYGGSNSNNNSNNSNNNAVSGHSHHDRSEGRAGAGAGAAGGRGGGENGPPQCSICLMEMANGEHKTALRCCHAFHTDCLDSWLRIKRECPLCKTVC